MERMRESGQWFDSDETADILDLAGAIESAGNDRRLGLSRADLYRIADELGISSAAVDEAVRRMSRQDRRSVKESRSTVRRRMRFLRHVLAYTVTVSILALVDALGGGGWWFFYIAGLWGIILALHALRFVTRRNGPLEQRIAGSQSSRPGPKNT
jgi:hypothetical protein